MSCKIDPPGEIILIPVLESNYRIGMREVLVGQQRELRFSLATSVANHCARALVENRFLLQNNVLRVDLLGIAQPANCTPGTSDAFTLTDRIVLPEQLYKLRIALGEAVVNQGLLRVNPDNYAIELPERTGISLESERLMRLPRSLVWGYVNPANSNAAAQIRTRVRADLENQGALSAELDPGYYGYFRIGNNHAITIPGATEQGVSFIYLLPDKDDAANLAALAAAWRGEFGPGADVALFNTAGEAG